MNDNFLERLKQNPSKFPLNSVQGKQILALVRDKAFAHAGEEEAIERMFTAIPKHADQHLLDVGCGLGGSADYLQKHGWGTVVGVDIDADTIAHAKTHFPNIEFYTADVVHLTQVLTESFDIIYLFNAFYAFPDQQIALRTMRQLAKKDTRLLIFEYTLRGDYVDSRRGREETLEISNPIVPANIEAMLNQANWVLQAQQCLDQDYIRWYTHFVAKITEKQQAITQLVGADGYEYVYCLYAHLLAELKRGALGGGIYEAVAK